MTTTTRTTLNFKEWEDLCGGNRPQCPPCECRVMGQLATKIRQIRQWDLDGINAAELITIYEDACITHDLSMFPALTKLIEDARKIRSLVEDNSYSYDYCY